MNVVVEKDVAVPMRDGVTLCADVYRPEAHGRFPVLLLRTPYNKDLYREVHLTVDPLRAAAAGWVVVVQDVRGRWRSQGEEFDPFLHEFEDGYDTVEWAAALPCSNGRVGAYGVSYMGATAWHAAATGPPSLRAIAPTMAPHDTFVNLNWRGGAFLWGTFVMWAVRVIGLHDFMRAKAADPDRYRQLLALVDDLDRFEQWTRHLPPHSFPPAMPDDPDFIPFFFEAMEHPTRDSYHRARSTFERHGEVAVPAFILAGWHDLLLGADLEHYRAMRRQAATEEARERTQLVIGPWAHADFQNVVGDLDFGLRTHGLMLDVREDLTERHLRWFSRWMREEPQGDERPLDRGSGDPDASGQRPRDERRREEPGEEPRVRIFVQGVNRWRDEDDWPLARARETSWYLAAQRRLTDRRPEGEQPPDAFVYDPLDPCPTRGGTLLLPRSYPVGPVDQTPLLARRDVLAYTSDPLDRDLEVTGPVTAVLHASTSGRDTDWVVKLCDVHPDGTTFNVCDGILRASYRASWESRELVEPGVVERYEVDLWATSQVFRAGHRLRVLVTSSDFPRYDRNPNTGDLGVAATRTVPALQQIFHDAARPSHLVLPVVD